MSFVTNVDKPRHYTSHPTGVECIDVVERMSFNLGNVVKYLWRAGLKGSRPDDLSKAAWYLKRGKLRHDCRDLSLVEVVVSHPMTHDVLRVVLSAVMMTSANYEESIEDCIDVEVLAEELRRQSEDEKV